MVGGVIVLVVCFAALFADFIAPADPIATHPRYTYAPPQSLGYFIEGEGFRPHVHGYMVEIDPVAIRRVFASDKTTIVPVGLFVKSEPYRMLGLIELGRKLVGPLDPGQPFYLLGADRLGRDMLWRILHGTRVSMSIGLVGVAVLLGLGVLLGGISGDNGGWVDDAV